MKASKASARRFFESLQGKKVVLSQIVTTEYFADGKQIHKSEATPFKDLERTVKRLQSNAVIFDNGNNKEGYMYTDQVDWNPVYVDEKTCETMTSYEGEYNDIEHNGIIYPSVQYTKTKRNIYQAV